MKLLDIVFHLPDLWKPWFIVAFTFASAVVAVVLAETGDSSFVMAILSVAAVLSGSMAWYFMQLPIGANEANARLDAGFKNKRVWIPWGVGVLLAVVGLIRSDSGCLSWIMGLHSFLLLGLWPSFLNRRQAVRIIIGGVLLSGPFVLSTVIAGDMRAGLFPAVLVIMLGWVALWIRELEIIVMQRQQDADNRIHLVFGKTLAWISTLLFVFGVISLWPWLGELYGQSYFWVLILGVLGPILFFWGRLRQPRTDDSKNALYRLSRVLPYCGMVLLLAFLLG